MTKNELKKQHILETIGNIQRKIDSLELQKKVQEDILAKIDRKIELEKNSSSTQAVDQNLNAD